MTPRRLRRTLRAPLSGLVLVLVASAGCLAPAGRSVQLVTEPPGASFDTSWGETGITPCRINVPLASDGGEILLRHDEFRDRDVRVEPVRERPVATFAMIAFGLLLDPFADEVGDETLRLEPGQRELHVVLEPAATR